MLVPNVMRCHKVVTEDLAFWLQLLRKCEAKH